MKTVVSLAALFYLASTHGPVYALDDMRQILPHAKAGECYARVLIPARYRTESSTVTVREATEKLEVIPAKYEWVEKQVQVSEADIKYDVVPATFRTVKEELELSPARSMWVTGSMYSSVSVNPEMLSLAKRSGVPIESASAGQCFTEYFEAPKFESVKEKILISEASETIQLVPATYEWIEEKQLVAAASQKMIEVPAVFETVTERVKVEDARVEWKKGRGVLEKIDDATGDIMCLVEVPAVYKTVEKTVMKSAPRAELVAEPERFEPVRVRKMVTEAQQVRTSVPARYREIDKQIMVSEGRHFWHEQNADTTARKTGNTICKKEIPAKTITINRAVLATPATVTQTEIPARFQSKKVRQLATKATEKRTVIPAVTRDITTRVKITDSKMEWRPVMCETNTTSTTVRRVQEALNKAGYDAGEVNGEVSSQTMSAVRRFQSAHSMATGGLTIELLNKLGVSPGN